MFHSVAYLGEKFSLFTLFIAFEILTILLSLFRIYILNAVGFVHLLQTINANLS
jgi:hypothetical protein